MSTITVTHQRSKVLNIVLWVVQVLLAAAFLMAGVMKLMTPIEELQKSMPWAGEIPAWLVRFIALSEFAAGLGFILPGLLRIRPQLTAYAGLGIALIMLLAIGFHLGRAEFMALPSNIVFGLLALFVAWGRWGATARLGKSLG